MTKLAFVVLVLSASGCKHKSDAPPKLGAKPLSDGTTCPIPKSKEASLSTRRFAVGAIPDVRIEAMEGHAAKCHDVFIDNDVVKTEGDHSRLVAEGTFGGHCPDEKTEWPRVYEAIKPAKAVVEINALAVNAENGLGLGKPVVLDSATPDKKVGVFARVVDRCGDKLEAEASGDVVTWTPAASCEKVATIAPYEGSVLPTKDKSQQMQVVALGPGTCTIGLEFLGVKGEVPVTVK